MDELEWEQQCLIQRLSGIHPDRADEFVQCVQMAQQRERGYYLPPEQACSNIFNEPQSCCNNLERRLKSKDAELLTDVKAHITNIFRSQA